MIRWLIWSQVGFVIISAVATLADHVVVSRSLFPPQAVLILCGWSAFIVPAFVVCRGRGRKAGTGQTIEVVASVGLGCATLFALLPLVE